MEITTITSKGQMTIPADIRRLLSLHAGDKLQCLIEDDHIVLIPSKGSVKSLKGMIPAPASPVTIEEMNAAIEAEASEHGSLQ